MTGLEGDALAARGVDRARMRRVGVGVNPAEIAGGDRVRFRAEQRIDGPLVLYIGAMAFDKGAVHTVEAMQRLWAQGENATLALIGAPLNGDWTIFVQDKWAIDNGFIFKWSINFDPTIVQDCSGPIIQ